MLKVKKAKPVKMGDSYFFRIPKQYINNGVINIDDRYDLDIKEKGG